MADIVKKEERTPTPEPSPEVNFALVLSRTIESVQKDPAELRATIYELARVKLMEQFGREDVKEVNRLVGALETAIQGVESFARHEEERLALSAAALPKALPPGPAFSDNEEATTERPRSSPSLSTTHANPRRPVDVSPLPKVAKVERAYGETADRPKGAGVFSSIVRLASVLVVVVFVVGVAFNWSHLSNSLESVRTAGSKLFNTTKTAIRSDPPAARPQDPKPEPPVVPKAVSAFPLPTTFGIYAVSEGQLYELKSLAGKVPDQRVAMSPAINTPSQTTLPSGSAKFIVFRRDSATNAPDQAEVRLIAKVTRAMGVDKSGKATFLKAQDNWVIRNILIRYKIGPVDDHPEMFLIQPETSDLILPAGRYVLVLKGQGFDFEVDGLVTDPRHCLERVDASNGAFYSPCPNSQ
jgi:hypothetical protein